MSVNLHYFPVICVNFRSYALKSVRIAPTSENSTVNHRYFQSRQDTKRRRKDTVSRKGGAITKHKGKEIKEGRERRVRFLWVSQTSNAIPLTSTQKKALSPFNQARKRHININFFVRLHLGHPGNVPGTNRVCRRDKVGCPRDKPRFSPYFTQWKSHLLKTSQRYGWIPIEALWELT